MWGVPIRSVMESRKLVLATPETSVSEAGRLMKKANVGAVLVVQQGRLVGIFTERDAVYRVMALDRETVVGQGLNQVVAVACGVGTSASGPSPVAEPPTEPGPVVPPVAPGPRPT